MSYRIGFLGTGHMGSSLALAIKDLPSSTLYLHNRTQEKALLLSKNIQNSEIVDFEHLIRNSDYLFLGVKPIDLEDVLKRLSEFERKPVLISMVAGGRIEDIQKQVTNPIIRILPNTPVAIKKGITLYSYGPNISEAMKRDFLTIMENTGEVMEVNEDDINAMSVITGSAPAYLNYFLDALIKASGKIGLKKETMEELALKMAYGTICLDLSSKKSPLELGKEVCSPGGSTIEGVRVMLEKGLYEMMEEAYEATREKNGKLVG